MPKPGLIPNKLRADQSSNRIVKTNISLREVQQSDLPIFFEQQLDPDATRMANFPARARDDFMSHWAKIMTDETTRVYTILFGDEVAGNVVGWEQGGRFQVGFWLGKVYWGQGIATAALSQLLTRVETRPLYAHVAKHNTGSIRVLQKCGFVICGEDEIDGVDGGVAEEFILKLEAKS